MPSYPGTKDICGKCAQIMKLPFNEVKEIMKCPKYNEKIYGHKRETGDFVHYRLDICIEENGREDTPNLGYSSHGCLRDWKVEKIMNLQRGNYGLEDLEYLEKKYEIKPYSKTIWLSPWKGVALSYAMLACQQDYILNMPLDKINKKIEEGKFYEPFTYELDNLIRIDETYDYEGGHLYIMDYSRLEEYKDVSEDN